MKSKKGLEIKGFVERNHIMSDLMPYGEQFEKIIDIVESAKDRLKKA